MSKYTCPYCFTKHNMNDVEFRCVNSTGNCIPEPDILLTRYEGGDESRTELMNKTFKAKSFGFPFIAKNFMPMREKCSCGEISNFRICPSCHNPLPPNIHDNEDMIISIVGSRASGKSHYIGVLIDELQKHIMPELFGAAFMETDKSIKEYYMSKYYVPLYKQNRSLDLTNPKERQKPLIYETAIRNGGNIKNLTFIFYDTAGENLEDLKTMSIVNKYICESAGIIFLIDPSQVEEIRDQMDKDILDETCNISWEEVIKNSPDRMVNEVAKLIRNDRKIRAGKSIDIPVAVAFSKLDAIENLIPKGSRILEESSNIQNGKYDKEEVNQINEEMKAMLASWGEKRITAVLNENFKNICYFGVSALGGIPEKTEEDSKIRKIRRPEPKRVADPFLWIMEQNGLIRK